MHKIGVVVVNHNRADLLEVALRSICPQANKVIVIDNASIDNSIQMIKEKFPKVILLAEEQELGFAGATTKGMNLLVEDCQYIFSCSNDVKLTSGCLTELARALDSFPILGAVAPHVVDGETCQTIPNGKADNLTGHPIYNSEHYDYLCGCAIMWKSSALKEVGFYRPEWGFYFEDVDLCFRLKASGYEIAQNLHAIVFHSQKTTLAKNRKRQLRYLTRNNLYFIQEHLSPVVLLVFLIITLPIKVLILALLDGIAVFGILLGVFDWLRRGRGLI